jgi:hypothetical protein
MLRPLLTIELSWERLEATSPELLLAAGAAVVGATVVGAVVVVVVAVGNLCVGGSVSVGRLLAA